MNDNGEVEEIAKGFEINEIVTGEVDGETISCLVRRLVIRSIKHAQAQEEVLNKRLKKAKTAIDDLTRPLSSYKCIKTLDDFWPAVNGILKQYNVEGLLEIEAFESTIKKQRRRYRDKPARVEIKHVFDVHVQDNEVALAATKKRFGWRVEALNAPVKRLSLDDAVLAYRDEYIIERGFGRLKGN